MDPFQNYSILIEPVTLQVNSEVMVDHPELARATIKIVLVSDGSMDPISGRAEFSWVVTKEEGQALIKKNRARRCMPI